MFRSKASPNGKRPTAFEAARLDKFRSGSPWADNPETQRQLNTLKRHRIVPKCPRCGEYALSQPDQAYGVLHRCCDLLSWNYKPLADQATLSARRRAHDAFDAIWQQEGFDRNACYEALAELMGMSRKACHIALMDAGECEVVIELCRDPRLRPLAKRLRADWLNEMDAFMGSDEW